MRIAAAQTRPVAGDIESNIDGHRRLIDLAVSVEADLVVFPELSITGYEPSLAEELATDPNDRRFDVFQEMSNTANLSIGIGTPTRNPQGVCISLLVFQPQLAGLLYSKRYLHPDEEAFFVPGPRSVGLIGRDDKAALAICYELSVSQHAADALRNGAKIYVASVAKSGDGVDKAVTRLAAIAREYSMTVLLSNCIGPSDGWIGGGRTSAWSSKGDLLGQLDETREGILLVNTETLDVVKQPLSS